MRLATLIVLYHYALFGAGYFFTVGAAQYGAECAPWYGRLVFVLFGAAAAVGFTLLFLSPSTIGPVRDVTLLLYTAACLHGSFAALGGCVTTPLALLCFSLLAATGPATSEPVIASILSTGFVVTMFVNNLLVPVHDNHAPRPCLQLDDGDTPGTSVRRVAFLAFTVGGFIHLLPMCTLHALLPRSTETREAFAMALMSYTTVTVLSCIIPPKQWVSALLPFSYGDMFLGGVTTREWFTIAAQCTSQLVAAAVTLWIARRAAIAPGPPSQLRAAHPFTLGVLMSALIAAFALHLDFPALTFGYSLVIGALLTMQALFFILSYTNTAATT